MRVRFLPGAPGPDIDTKLRAFPAPDPKVIANRLEIYERETAPILDVYRDRGLVVRIDGVGSLDDVTTRIFDALTERGLQPNGDGTSSDAA